MTVDILSTVNNNPLLLGVRRLEKIRIKSKYLLTSLSSSASSKENNNDNTNDVEGPKQNGMPTSSPDNDNKTISKKADDNDNVAMIRSIGDSSRDHDSKNSKICKSTSGRSIWSNSVVSSCSDSSNSDTTTTTISESLLNNRLDSYNNKKQSIDSSTTNVANDDDDGSVALITGIEDVILGKKPASESVRVLGIQPWRYVWFMMSGGLCDLVQLSIDFILHVLLFKIQDASICWAISFGLSIAVRHTSHKYLVFGDYVGGYWNSLGRMYAGYSIIIVITTIYNAILTRVFLLTHYVAWVLTFIWAGVANYFILKKVWSFDGSTGINICSTSSSFSSCSNTIKTINQKCCMRGHNQSCSSITALEQQGFNLEDNQEHLEGENSQLLSPTTSQNNNSSYTTTG